MKFVNDRQRKAVMSRLRTYRVQVPVYNEIEVLVKAPEGDLGKIMDKAVKQAEIDEPKTPWMYDEDSADASEWDIVKMEDRDDNDRPVSKAYSVKGLKKEYAEDIAKVEARKDVSTSEKEDIKKRLKLLLDTNIKIVSRDTGDTKTRLVSTEVPR
ncbi:hypothetical protein GQ472_01745 [archaeon]|nr:hypothetical protein [archaeon]